MSCYVRVFTIPASLLLLTSLANGQYSRQQNDQGKTLQSNTQKGWAAYLAANTGYSTYNSNISVEGNPASLKLLGSYVTQSSNAVIDLGYGVQYQRFSQGSAETKELSTGVMEVAARYQFDNRWQLGGIYNQLFNKGQNYGSNQADIAFGGIQILREIGFGGNYLGRFGGRVLTSLNVDNESVNMGMIEFQMGRDGSLQKNKSNN